MARFPLNLLIFPLLLALLAAGPAAAQPLTMTAGLQLGSTYRTDCWQPIHLELRNDGDAEIHGVVVVPLSDPRAPATMVLPVSVPPRALVRATMWAYFPPPASEPSKNLGASAPPLAIAEFRSRDGALLTRAQVTGIPLSAAAAGEAADKEDRGELILVVGEGAEAADELHEATWLIGQLSEDSGVRMTVAKVGPERFPREAAGLSAVKAIVLEAIDPDALDWAQRDALVGYVRGGGVMVLAAPDRARAGSWLAPLLPVSLIGTREASEIEVSAGGKAKLKLRRATAIIEAIESEGGEVLLRGRDFVHAAVRSVGLGRVVFTSFPINALDGAQPQVSQLWSQLLALDRPPGDWRDSQLGKARYQVLGSMIGRKVAPWGVAAAVAGGYLAAILIAQGIFFGASRPKAFTLTLAVAVGLSATLVAMGMARREGQSLQAARLAILDVAGDGGGWRQEALACVGADQPTLALAAADERAMLRAALADDGNRPTIRQQPFAVEQADIRADRIERVWEASAPLDRRLRLSATGRFGPQGLTLEVENDLGQPIAAPMVVWNQRALSSADLPAGRMESLPLRVNERGDFTTGAVVASEQSKRRGMLVAASLTPANTTASATRGAPMLIGWIDDAGENQLIRTAQDVEIEEKSLAMVRTPLRIELPSPGTTISVPSALVELKGRLPYDQAKGQSAPSQQGGEWLIGFAVPPQVGQVRPGRVTLEARVTLPAHTMVIRRGQCAGGTVQLNRIGDVVAEWGGEVGSKQLDIECTPRDFDQAGCVWLLLEVGSTNSAGGTPVAWQIKELGMRIDAQAVAPPPPIVFDSAAPIEIDSKSEESR